MVVGRDPELAAVDAFLGTPGGGTLVLEGEAGIGKTTLWRAAIELAQGRGRTVLASSPGAAETRLTFVGLADFLDRVDTRVFERLPPPQRQALDVALLHAEAVGTAPDQRAVSTAFLTVLRTLVEEGPLLVAVDDVQWLDSPSWRVLEFARRRLERERVKFLVAVRLEQSARERELDGGERVRLGALNLAALHDVLHAELGVRFPRPAVVRIAQASSGNPFFAVEVGRAIRESSDVELGAGPLPVPDNLRELLDRRLRKLPASARDALLRASALARPSVEVVDRGGLAPAEDAGVVRVEPSGHIHFTHPLLATAVYGAATPARRRRVHSELARDVTTAEERARHLALAAEAPDGGVATALLDAARQARDRGAPDTAIELTELACRLTPTRDVDTLRARRLELGRLLAEVGDPRQAISVLSQLVEDTPSSALRARALVLLAFQEEWAQGSEAASQLCEQALLEAGEEDIELRAEIHAAASRTSDHDVQRKLAHAEAAVELGDRLAASHAVRAYALLAFAEAAFYAGRGIVSEVFDRAAALEEQAEGATTARLLHRVHHYSDVRPSERLRGILAIYADEFDLARTEFERERQIALDYGDDVQLARSLARLAIVELRAGDWQLSEERLGEMAAVLDRSGQDSGRWWIRSIRAALDAHAGRFDSARQAGAEALAMARSPDQEAETRIALGFLELSAAQYAAARKHLDRVHDIVAEIGIREPGLFRYHADRIEALLALGAVDEAEAAVEELARDAARPWALVALARSRALGLAARGDLDAAAEAVERALEVPLPIPFERARNLLAQGRLHRRRKERLLAKAALEESGAIFDALGARLWAEQARGELQRVGLRKVSSDALTASEERVAALAAGGLTNREIADRIFISPKTVEANLARVYRKLGIRSRAELGARMPQT